MKKEEIETLYKLYDKFEEEVIHVFNKLDNNNLLDFYSNSYETMEINAEETDIITVKYYDYGYDLYECSSVSFPTNILGDDDKISDYIGKLKKEKELNKKLEEERRKKLEEEGRRKIYEELRKEFETKL